MRRSKLDVDPESAELESPNNETNVVSATPGVNSVRCFQRIIKLQPHPRGFHVITGEVVAQLPELRQIEIGSLHLFIQHTSASLVINENISPEVRDDLERHLTELVPEGPHHYEHTLEGDDDMPAHIKSVMLGGSVTIPVGQGALLLGTWQGIYLGEHRDHGGARTVVATLFGKEK
jgi:secondary thiamine-phosphate synthase enzyme